VPGTLQTLGTSKECAFGSMEKGSTHMHMVVFERMLMVQLCVR
jgi:hypothetical protein